MTIDRTLRAAVVGFGVALGALAVFGLSQVVIGISDGNPYQGLFGVGTAIFGTALALAFVFAFRTMRPAPVPEVAEIDPDDPAGPAGA